MFEQCLLSTVCPPIKWYLATVSLASAVLAIRKFDAGRTMAGIRMKLECLLVAEKGALRSTVAFVCRVRITFDGRWTPIRHTEPLRLRRVVCVTCSTSC